MTQKPLHITRDGFRYHWGEDDEPLCSKYIRELNNIDAGRRLQLSNFTKRKIIPPIVRLSENDRAPQLKLSEDRTRVTGEKGYSMVRATHGINRGKFYFEVNIDLMPDSTATRIGWSQCYSNLQAPLGYDSYGYSWRSRFGTKFHQARGKTFDKTGGYGTGDTIGCMIELPFSNPKNHTLGQHLPPSIKDIGSVLISKKKDSSRMLEETDRPPDPAKMKPLVGSRISFYKNGRFVGVAFEDIYEGFYYPAISLYRGCIVSANFGPRFKYPPEKFNVDNKNHLFYKPVNDIAEITIIDNFLSDMLFVIGKEVDDDDPNLAELIRPVKGDMI